MSVLVASNNVNAQTIESITQSRKSLGEGPQITVGKSPTDILINEATNKIYVTNTGSGTVSVIDSDSGNTKTLRVGLNPISIAVDEEMNRIYVLNQGASSENGTVSVIDGYNDSKIKDIPVGMGASAIAIDTLSHEIYVANSFDGTVSLIDGTTNTKQAHDIPVELGPTEIAFAGLDIAVVNQGSKEGNGTQYGIVSFIPDMGLQVSKEIPVGNRPSAIATDDIKIYVVCRGDGTGNGTVSVIDGYNHSKDIIVGRGPSAIASDTTSHMIYVANTNSDTVSVINGTTNTKQAHDIPVGSSPSAIAIDRNKIYVLNQGATGENGTVSVIDGYNHSKTKDIIVGSGPSAIASDTTSHMIYVANKDSDALYVISGYSDKIAAGITFNVNPANSGKIICNNAPAPTNIYLYVDAGTNCTAQPGKGFEFNSWVENLPTNRNSSIPLDSSGNLTVNRYGAFTVNFKPVPPPIPPEYSYLIISVIVSSIIGWSIPSIFGWFKARTQLKHLEECMDQIGKLDKNVIENKIKGYYVHGKLSEDHRQFLKDKISEYYEGGS